jgi:hypothetical protein
LQQFVFAKLVQKSPQFKIKNFTNNIFSLRENKNLFLRRRSCVTHSPLTRSKDPATTMTTPLVTVKPVIASTAGSPEEGLQGHINCIRSSSARTSLAKGFTTPMAIDLSGEDEFTAAWVARAEDIPAGSELKTDAFVRLYQLAKEVKRLALHMRVIRDLLHIITFLRLTTLWPHSQNCTQRYASDHMGLQYVCYLGMAGGSIRARKVKVKFILEQATKAQGGADI